jgi:hypothetical protein
LKESIQCLTKLQALCWFVLPHLNLSSSSTQPTTLEGNWHLGSPGTMMGSLKYSQWKDITNMWTKKKTLWGIQKIMELREKQKGWYLLAWAILIKCRVLSFYVGILEVVLRDGIKKWIGLNYRLPCWKIKGCHLYVCTLFLWYVCGLYC